MDIPHMMLAQSTQQDLQGRSSVSPALSHR